MRFSSAAAIFSGVLVRQYLWAGCNIINPVEPTPTYIHIDSFSFANYPPGMDPHPLTDSHDITQVWAYYNNSLIGEFDLPCTFPVIKNGTDYGKLELFPGVVYDGQNNTVDIYPFYQPDTSFVVSGAPGTVARFTPSTTYYENAKPSSQFRVSFDKLTTVPFGVASGTLTEGLHSVFDDSLVFEGTGTGEIYMSNPGVDSLEDSSVAFPIPSGSAFIEFNYRSDVQFYVGVRSNISGTVSSTPYYLAGIQPTADNKWRKFYLNVKAFALTYPGDNYNFYIKTSLPAGQATGKLLIDNIQLLTF